MGHAMCCTHYKIMNIVYIYIYTTANTALLGHAMFYKHNLDTLQNCSIFYTSLHVQKRFSLCMDHIICKQQFEPFSCRWCMVPIACCFALQCSFALGLVWSRYFLPLVHNLSETWRRPLAYRKLGLSRLVWLWSPSWYFTMSFFTMTNYDVA